MAIHSPWSFQECLPKDAEDGRWREGIACHQGLFTEWCSVPSRSVGASAGNRRQKDVHGWVNRSLCNYGGWVEPVSQERNCSNKQATLPAGSLPPASRLLDGEQTGVKVNKEENLDAKILSPQDQIQITPRYCTNSNIFSASSHWMRVWVYVWVWIVNCHNDNHTRHSPTLPHKVPSKQKGCGATSFV